MKPTLIIAMALMVMFGAYNKDKSGTIVAGRLPDLKDEIITLIPVDDYFPGLKSDGVYPTVRTDSLGEFKFYFRQESPDFYQIIHHNYNQLGADLFIAPGDSIYLEKSSWKSDPKFMISGKGSEKLKHLEKDYALFPKDKDFYNKIQEDSFTTEFDFKNYIDSIHFARVNALNSFTSIPDLLKNHHLNTLNAERADFLLEHLERRNYYTQGEFNYFFPNESYYHFLDSITFDSDFSRTTAAKLLASQYLKDKVQHAFKGKQEEEFWHKNLSWKLNYIAGQPSALWTDLLALSTINDYSLALMTDSFFNDISIFEGKANGLFQSAKYWQLFKTGITPYKKLAPGNPAPDFALPDANGKLCRLSDFKGQVAYVNFWGTWCYPCIEAIPAALSLQEKYKDAPVAFIYVALEYNSEDIIRWKEFIAGKSQMFGKFLNNQPFPGIHLVAEKQFRNESISAYKVNFAPTYVLIDQSGSIVSARAKPVEGIAEEIDKLLSKSPKQEPGVKPRRRRS